MAWIYLLCAGLLEIVWATALKHSDGFSRPWPSVVGIAAATASFVLLTLALRHLPIGSAYAIWVGIGVVGTAAVGILALEEPVTPARVVFLALILIGVVGIKLVD